MVYGFLYSISLAKIILVSNFFICHLQIMAKASDFAFNNFNVGEKGKVQK
jgi:hypothetical protein